MQTKINNRQDYFRDIPKALKNRAQQILYSARRRGKISKMPCIKCGSDKSQAHHEDYSSPLDVVWLCDFHHKSRHRELDVKVIHI